jgi:hypothetical protein
MHQCRVRRKLRGETFFKFVSKFINDQFISEELVVYYESIKRELKIKPIYECRCDENYILKLNDLHVSHTLVLRVKIFPKYY